MVRMGPIRNTTDVILAKNNYSQWKATTTRLLRSRGWYAYVTGMNPKPAWIRDKDDPSTSAGISKLERLRIWMRTDAIIRDFILDKVSLKPKELVDGRTDLNTSQKVWEFLTTHY